MPETLEDLKPCLHQKTCHYFDPHNPGGQGTAYKYFWNSVRNGSHDPSLAHITCFESERRVFEP